MKDGILLCVVFMTFDFSNAWGFKCYKCEGDTRISNKSYNDCEKPARSLQDGKLSVDVVDCREGCKTSDWEEVPKNGVQFSLFTRDCMPDRYAFGCSKITRSDKFTGRPISEEDVCHCDGDFCNGGVVKVVKCYKCSGDTRKSEDAYNDCKNPVNEGLRTDLRDATSSRYKLSLPEMQCFEGCRTANEVVKKGGKEFSLFSRGCLTKGEKRECEKIERNDPKRGKTTGEICNCEENLCNDRAGGNSQRLSFFALSIPFVILISELNLS